jgi:hypothetical protein
MRNEVLTGSKMDEKMPHNVLFSTEVTRLWPRDKVEFEFGDARHTFWQCLAISGCSVADKVEPDLDNRVELGGDWLLGRVDSTVAYEAALFLVRLLDIVPRSQLNVHGIPRRLQLLHFWSWVSLAEGRLGLHRTREARQVSQLENCFRLYLSSAAIECRESAKLLRKEQVSLSDPQTPP